MDLQPNSNPEDDGAAHDEFTKVTLFPSLPNSSCIDLWYLIISSGPAWSEGGLHLVLINMHGGDSSRR